MWMTATFIAFIMSAMAVATIGGFNYAEKNGRDLLAAGAAVRQGEMSAGFFTRLKAKLEHMMKVRKRGLPWTVAPRTMRCQSAGSRGSRSPRQ